MTGCRMWTTLGLWAVLVGCPAEDKNPVDETGTPVDDSGTAPDDSGTPTDDSATSASCTLVTGIALSETDVVLPTAGVGAEVIDAGSTRPYTVTWTATGGVLDLDTGAAVTWMLDEPVARFGRESLTVTATATADGCEPQTVEATLEADWPDHERVVVLYNPSVDRSQEVADYYASMRGIPAGAVCGVPSAVADRLAREDFEGWITAAQDCIDAVGERVYYVVPVYGVPFEVSSLVKDIGYGHYVTTSLDAQLVFGDGTLDRLEASKDGAYYNPIYRQGSSIDGAYDDWVPFGEMRAYIESLEEDYAYIQSDWKYYMVARIDGASPDAAKALVDRAGLAQELADAGALDGNVYVDGRYGDDPPNTDTFGSYESGEWNMWGTWSVFDDLGWYPTTWDGNDAEYGTAPAPTSCPEALYFAGWYGTPDHYNGCFEWAPGAIGGHLDSFSCQDPRQGTNWVHNALEAGITATFGAVEEPYVAGMPEYDQFFLYLTDGASFGEAAYQSTALAHWMMVWVGDPLYRPYP